MAKLAPSITPTEIVVRSEKIREGVGRLEALVSRVQAAAEIEQRDVVVRPGQIDAEAFLASLKDDYEGSSELELEFHCERANLYGARDLLHQAVASLVSNAVKYSPKPAEVTISVRRSELTGGAEIAVDDKGCGIPADEIERVFEPYYRARNTSGIRGLGLGLYLVAQAIGVSVTIADWPLERASASTFRLPRSEPDEPRQDPVHRG